MSTHSQSSWERDSFAQPAADMHAHAGNSGCSHGPFPFFIVPEFSSKPRHLEAIGADFARRSAIPAAFPYPV